MVDRVGRMLAHYLEKPVRRLRALHAERRRRVARGAAARRRAAGRRQQPHLRRHQVSHAVDLVARRALCRADRRPRHRKTASRWCWSRPISARAWSAAPLSKYARFHTRICRPIGLTDDDRARVCAYAAERIGFDYDLKNIIDLMRYLLPLPVPQRWRRRMMALGSGHPTRIICSALIAQAFENVRYPILPKVTPVESEAARQRDPRDPPFLALRAARFRHLALFRGGQADHRQGLRLQGHGLGGRAGARCRRAGQPGAGRERNAWKPRIK